MMPRVIIPTPQLKLFTKIQSEKKGPSAKKMLYLPLEKGIISDLTNKDKPGAGQQLISRHEELNNREIQRVQENKEPKNKKLLKVTQLQGKVVRPKIYTPKEVDELLKAGKIKQANIKKVQTIHELLKAGKITQLPGKIKQANMNNLQEIEKVTEAGKVQENIKLPKLKIMRTLGSDFVVSKQY